MAEPDGPTGSTVPRRQLGRILGELRERAGLKVNAAAKLLERSPTTMWRVEQGKVSSRAVEVKAMCELYGASPALTEALVGLAHETKAKGWWHAYGDAIPEGFDLYIGLEETATHLDWYEPELIPGLLQTGEYAHAVIQGDNPDEEPGETARRVQVRIKRQTLLTRVTQPPTLNVALNEAVLRRPVGGNNAMAGQLRHLGKVSHLPTVTIKVVPFSAGLHRGVMSGQFQILRFPLTGNGRETEPPTVYADGYTGDLYLDKPREVERYDNAFRDIWAKAMPEEASRRLILEMAGHYEQG
ncbi:helix-turn-helix domain-containing protein [Streptomyces sp. NPDC090442]|uniref:helix-turn-helix domain-containing protein n=1 Tax=Streptomyces sp. NPDC090442 TaxID=3365962 RepID=UPI003810328F